MFLPIGIFVFAFDQDPRGPIQEDSRPPVVGKQSVQEVHRPVAISPEDKGPGFGEWIWNGEPNKSTAVRFRKQVRLESPPKLAKAWITAEVRYRMWINGRLAARGPADAGRDYDSGPCGPWFEDVRDLTKFFKKGENVVAVEVFPTPLVSSDASTGHPGLKVDLRIQTKDLATHVVGTDASWRAALARDLDQSGAQRGFRVDMNQEPTGWRSTGFDDRDWNPAEVATEAQRPTLVSELAPPMEAELHPVDVVRVSEGLTPNPSTGGARILRDGSDPVRYGHILSGYVGLKIKGQAGVRLQIMPNEHDAPGWNRQAEIILRNGEQVVELPYFDSFSVINIKAEGVREPIDIEGVRCTFTSYPVQYLGDFSCSNPGYNRIWEIARWVTQICMQTHHLDSPHHQEPISDAGDYLIESLNSLYAFGEGTLARQDLKKIARTLAQRHYQSFHTSYSLLWLRMLIQYYEYTGDVEPIRQLAPDVFRLLDRFETYIGANGLISQAPNYMFLDWVEVEGFTLHHPPAVIGQGYMTALYYRALDDAIQVANVVGDHARIEKFKSLRKAVHEAFDRELWVPDEGLYRDGKPFQTSVLPNQWLPADKRIETFTTQVNSLAVACGLTSPTRAHDVMLAVLSRSDLHCQPYFMHFVFEAIAAAGLFNQEAEKQLQRWKIVPDTQSFYEMWNVGDLSHAWNATPLFQMSGRILGVEPTTPGFAYFRIQPHPCGLTWAKGRVPTPHGPISVSWKKDGEAVNLDFTVPTGTEAEVGGATYPSGRHRITVKMTD